VTAAAGDAATVLPGAPGLAAGRGLPAGPSLPAAVTTAAWVAAPQRFITACATRYGPTFTLRFTGEGPGVWIAHPDDLRAVFAAPTRAGAVNWQLAPVLGDRSVLLLDGDEHLHRRRLLLGPFHGEVLGRWAGVIAGIAADHVQRWPTDGAFATRPLTQALTLDAILAVVLGPAARDTRGVALRSALVDWLAVAASPLALVPALRRDLGPRSPYGRFLRGRARVRHLLADALRASRESPDGGDDVLAVLAHARDETGAPLPDDEAVDQLVTLLVAGHETTAAALAWALSDLSHAPEALRAATDEARAVDANAVRGTGAPVLTAVVRETLRLHPPIPIVGRCLLEPLELRTGTLPARTVVVPCIWLAGRDGASFPDPHAFLPERWLDDADAVHAAPTTWLPFGGGIRRCLGASFAELEMRLVLREVLARRELRPAGGRERPGWRAIVLAPSRGGRVRAGARRAGAGAPA
jgi:cytochrome P450